MESPSPKEVSNGTAPAYLGRLPAIIARLKRRPNVPFTAIIARYLERLYMNAPGPVPCRVHGFEVLLNPGNSYPFIIQGMPLFNAPLVELVHQVSRSRGRPASLVDVGAATGDTVLLLKQRCPNDLDSVLSVEGDQEFFELLKRNVGSLPKVTLVQAMLAREAGLVRSLVKHHAGTAAALGDTLLQGVRLDSLDYFKSHSVDVLKIDVDGYDGEVLAGASNLLAKDHPAVVFEWHPNLIQRTGQQYRAAFEVLETAGYSRMLWFNNTGTFSHFMSDFSATAIDPWVRYLLKVNHRADEHFDVVALHKSDLVDDIELAAMDFARSAAVGRE
jgi:FkbM family methyltransferase